MMRILPTVLLLVALLVVPAAASAKLPSGPYRTDEQAARYIERHRGGQAFCLNGYYSRHEKRTGRHFPQRDDERYRSFTCAWTSPGSKTSTLYVQTRWGPWVIMRDR